ncbi:hypothetical protein [Mycolicibacterium sp. CBM1]
MAESDDEAAAASAPPQTATINDLRPGTRDWRVNVAMCADRFFSVAQDPEIARAIGKNPGVFPVNESSKF